MDFFAFQQSLSQATPPPKISKALQALWWDAKGHWDKAHELAQGVHGADGAWVHAYLHRKEKDEWNAGYWYSRAVKPRSDDALEDEWEEIAVELLRHFNH